MQVFFNVLDLAARNAWIIYKKATGVNIKYHDFISNLSEELHTKYITSKNLCFKMHN